MVRDLIQKNATFPLPRILRRVKALAHVSGAKVSDGSFLEEAMHDAIVRQLMATDNLDESDVRLAIYRTQGHQ